MGIEPCPKTAQVFESTHHSSSIWVHPGAEFCVWTESFAYVFDSLPLLVTNEMCVHLKCNTRIRMTHLLLGDLSTRSHVYEQACVTVAERVHPCARDFQCIEHGPEPVFHDLVCRMRPPLAVEKIGNLLG